VSRRAAIYTRISSDPAGQRLGVTRQLTDCRKKAVDLGWDVVAVYEDNDVSASTTRTRPQYVKMLAALEAGQVDGVVVWDLDRLTRRPIEIEQFIDLADRRGIALASVGGDCDLATDIQSGWAASPPSRRPAGRIGVVRHLPVVVA
jgi:site-specific DNA recombinase